MPPSLDQLIDTYLQAVEEGVQPDVKTLLAAAGEQRAELERWIETHQAVDRYRLSIEALAEAAQPQETAPPGDFKQYETLVEIGSGGMAQVYRARDRTLDRAVAIKFIKAESLPAPDAWLHEARTLAHLDHPNVVRVFDAGHHEGQPFLAMELVDGLPLNKVLDALAGRTTVLDEELVDLTERLSSFEGRLRFAIELATALRACHEHGILHRDLKPRNVLVTLQGHPKLVDFGLAHHSKVRGVEDRITERLYGTPAYLAPEQMQSGRTGDSTRTDVYAFGMILYELFALERPERNPIQGLPDEDEIRYPDPPPIPEVPRELNDVIRLCLANSPEKRYPSAELVRRELQRIVEQRPIAAVPPRLGRRLQLWARRQPRAAALGKFAGILLVAALVVDFFSHRSDRAEVLAGFRAAPAFQEGTADPAVIQASLAELRPRIPEVHDLDGSLWKAFFSGTVGAEIGAGLDQLALRITNFAETAEYQTRYRSWKGKVVANNGDTVEVDEELRLDWTRSPWHEVAESLSAFEAELDGGTRMEFFLKRPGTVLLDAAGGPHEVWVQTWAKNEADSKNPFAAINAPQRIAGTTPIEVLLTPESFYRLTFVPVDGSGEFHQLNFLVSAIGTRPTIRLAPRQPTWTDSVEVAAGEIRLAGLNKTGTDTEGRAQYGPYPVPAFRIDRRLVTWGDFRRFLADQPDWAAQRPALLALLAEQDPPEETLCRVPRDYAVAYARWRGARLPTLIELTRLRDEYPEVARVPACARPASESARKWDETWGEWIEDTDPSFNPLLYSRYALAPDSLAGAPPVYAARFQMMQGGSFPPGGCVFFRCATSLEPPLRNPWPEIEPGEGGR